MVEVLSSTPVPSVAPSPDARHVKMAENLAKLATMSAIISDESGLRSEAEKVKTYLEMFKLVVAGTFHGGSSEANDLFGKALNSSTGQRIYNLNTNYTQSVNGIFTSSGHRNLGRIMLDAFDTYSKEDQDILFNQVISPFNMAGTRKYADEARFRAHVDAVDTIKTFVKAAEAEGKTAQTDQTYAKALALLERNDTETQTWTALVLKLFGKTQDYQLDLSSEAKARLGDWPSSDASPTPYEMGSIASRHV